MIKSQNKSKANKIGIVNNNKKVKPTMMMMMKPGKSLGIGLFESGHDVELYPPKNAKPADTITITVDARRELRRDRTSCSKDSNNNNGYAFYYDNDVDGDDDDDDDDDDDISAISMSSRFIRRVQSVNSVGGIEDDNFPKICGRLIKIGSKMQIEGMIERSGTNDNDEIIPDPSSSSRRLETMDSIFSEQL